MPVRSLADHSLFPDGENFSLTRFPTARKAALPIPKEGLI